LTDSPDEKLTLDAAGETLSAIAPIVDQLIAAWDSAKTPPKLTDFLPAAGGARRLALVELIKIDLEYRWLVHSFPKQVEQYLAEFPELSEGGVPLDLLYEEYQLRKQAGQQVSREEFVERFPEQAQPLARLLGTLRGGSTAVFRPQRADLVKDLRPGDRFDDFELLSVLGRGAFASVFLARQSTMQRLVALKVSAIRGAEHQTLAQFDHDHIVRIFDQRTLPEHRAQLLYMQYVPGPTLQAVIGQSRGVPPQRRSGKLLLQIVDQQLRERGEDRSVEGGGRAKLATLSWSEVVCWIGSRLASALQHAHRHGVLHRDVKPANVLLNADGAPKLADFNVSFCSKIEGASPAAYFGGSLAYMSPEQLEACNPHHPRDADTLDARSDVFALGVVLWELLLGQRPFDDPATVGNWPDTIESMVQLRRRGADRHLLVQSGQCPSGVERVLCRCLASRPEDRWSTAGDVARHLELCAEADVQGYLYPEPWSWRRRIRKWLLPLLLLITVLPSALAAVFNFVYNRAEIIAHMDAAAETHFMRIQAVINATAFPLGMALVILVGHWVLRVSGRQDVPAGQLAASRRHGPRLGLYASAVCVVLWLLAGLAYPLSMHLGRFEVPASTYPHFFVSLALCGLFAVSLTFFGVTWLMLRAAMPAVLEQELPQGQAASMTDSVARWVWFFLAMSASVPMLAAVALTAVDSPNIRGYLLLISISGMAAFALVVWLFRGVLRDLQLIGRACQ
jgi:serine/threonine protein kinase